MAEYMEDNPAASVNAADDDIVGIPGNKVKNSLRFVCVLFFLYNVLNIRM